MSRVRNSFLLSGAERYASLLINLVLMMIAARLLSPDEVGIYVIGTGVVTAADAVREFGAGAYLVQEKTLTREDARTAFTVMAGLAFAIAVCLNVVAAPLASFYEDARLATVIAIGSIGVVLAPFGSVIAALMRRDMSFGRIALVGLSFSLANLVCMAALGLTGWGYLSLPVAAVVASAVGGGVALWLCPTFWLFVPSLGGWRKVLGFGGLASATTILNVGFQLLPQLLLGRLAGIDVAGLYNRAANLCQLPERALVNAFQPVILPAFAAQARAGRDLGPTYLWGLSMITAVQWPALICLAVLAELVVETLFGPRWSDVAPLLRIMALAALPLFAAPLTYPMLIAIGRVRSTLTASLITLPPSVIVVCLAAQAGPESLAASAALTGGFQMAVAMHMIRTHVSFRWIDVAHAVWRSAAAALMAAGAALAAQTATGAMPHAASLAIALVCGASGWLLALVLTRHPLLAEARSVAASLATAARSA